MNIIRLSLIISLFVVIYSCNHNEESSQKTEFSDTYFQSIGQSELYHNYRNATLLMSNSFRELDDLAYEIQLEETNLTFSTIREEGIPSEFATVRGAKNYIMATVEMLETKAKLSATYPGFFEIEKSNHLKVTKSHDEKYGPSFSPTDFQ